MSNRTMKYGVREKGAADRGYARFVALSDAQDFIRLVNNGAGQVVDLITGKVVK